MAAIDEQGAANVPTDEEIERTIRESRELAGKTEQLEKEVLAQAKRFDSLMAGVENEFRRVEEFLQREDIDPEDEDYVACLAATSEFLADWAECEMDMAESLARTPGAHPTEPSRARPPMRRGMRV